MGATFFSTTTDRGRANRNPKNRLCAAIRSLLTNGKTRAGQYKASTSRLCFLDGVAARFVACDSTTPHPAAARVTQSHFPTTCESELTHGWQALGQPSEFPSLPSNNPRELLAYSW